MALIIIDAGEDFTLADDGNEIRGRAGSNESVFIQDGAEGNTTNAEIERIDLPQNLNDYTFQVTANGLEISLGGTVIVTLPSLNQVLELRFADGDATLEQTGGQSFDLDGGAGGTVTIGTTPVDDPAITLGANISETANGGGGGGGTGDTFILTVNQDVIDGTADDDTIFGIYGSLSGGDDANPTYTPGDNIDGGGGFDELRLSIAGSSGADDNEEIVGATVEDVEKISFSGTGSGDDTFGVNASGWSGVDIVMITNTENDLAIGDVSYNSTFGSFALPEEIDQIVLMNLTGNSGDSFAFQFASNVFNGDDDEIDIVLSNTDSSDDEDLVLGIYNPNDEAIIETLNITSTGNPLEENYLEYSGEDPVLTTINIDGDANLKLEGSFEGFDGVENVDASAFTADLEILLSGDNDLVYIGGQGNDTVIVDDSLAEGDDLDGGSGDCDVLGIDLATALGASEGVEEALFENFEGIRVDTGLSGGNEELDVDLWDSVQKVELGNGFDSDVVSGDDTISGFMSGAELTYLGEAAGPTAMLTVDIDDGSNDVFNIKLADEGTDASDYGLLVTNDTETLNFEVSGSGGDNDSISLDAPGTTTINVTGGDDNLALIGSGTDGLPDVESIDASTFEEGLAVDLSTAPTDNDNDVVVLGGEGDNVITGGSGDDSIVGQGGDDSLIGSLGDDTLVGNGGDDTLSGGSGNDDIDGGSASDTIDGGAGADALSGGSASDTFDYNAATESSGTTIDTIDDFVSGIDLLDLAGITAGTFTFLGNFGSQAAAESAFTATNNEAVFLTNSNEFVLDVDNSDDINTGDLVISLPNTAALDDGDFLF